MSNIYISDELLSKFMEGKTSEKENSLIFQSMNEDVALLEEMTAIGEAAQLADTQPVVNPNLKRAEEQIKSVLSAGEQKMVSVAPSIRKSRMKVIWAAAASIVCVVAVALFFLLKHDSPEQHFAQNGEDSTVVAKPKLTTEPMVTQTTQKQKETVSEEQSEENNADNEAVSAQEKVYSAQKLEKQYASTQIANNLTIVRPSKSNYSVLCKNLEKTFYFEWETDNVQSLHFIVKNEQNQTVVEQSDKTAKQYLLKYKDVYPNQILYWSLTVKFTDGTQQTRSGQIQIDYSLTNE